MAKTLSIASGASLYGLIIALFFVFAPVVQAQTSVLYSQTVATSHTDYLCYSTTSGFYYNSNPCRIGQASNQLPREYLPAGVTGTWDGLLFLVNQETATSTVIVVSVQDVTAGTSLTASTTITDTALHYILFEDDDWTVGSQSIKTFDPAHSYLVSFAFSHPTRLWGNSATTTGWYYTCVLVLNCSPADSTTVKDLYYTFYSGVAPAIPSDVTQINSLSPGVDGLQATSTTFNFTLGGNVAPADWDANMKIYVRWRQQTGMGLRDNGPLSQGGEFTIPVTGPGAFSLSDTSSYLTHSGQYQAYAAIQKPSYTIFGFVIPFFTNTLYSTTWKFTAGTSTPAERAAQNLLFETTGLGGSTVATSTTADLSCVPSTQFSVTNCLRMLFFPSTADITNMYNNLSDNFLTRVPFGYITRFTTIMTGNTVPVEPPALTYTFGSSSTSALGAVTLTFQPWDHFDVITTVKSDDGQNKTIWDIVNPWFTLVTSLAVLSVILGDVIGLEFGSFGKKTSSNGTEYREETDRSIRRAVKKGGGMGLRD